VPVTCVVVSLVLHGSIAHADSTHYQTLQLGERSRGMAAAYTAFAADGAAIWYNPAGLPLLEPRLLQGSLALFQLRKIDIDGALAGESEAPGALTIESNPSLPVFGAATFALGKKREEYGNRQAFQIAISAFQTYNEQLSGDVRFSDSLGRTNSIQFLQVDRQTYLGAGFGWRALKRFLVGISVFASNRTLDHAETLALAFGGTQNPSSGSPCPGNPTLPLCIEDARQVNRSTTFGLSAWHFVMRIGLMQLIGDRWRLGLMFQPPGIPMGGKSNLRFELSDVDARVSPAPSVSTLIDVASNANAPMPWILRLGTSYVVTKKATVALDLQLVGRVRSGQITNAPAEVDPRLNATGVFLVTETERKFTWNISIGTEIQITRNIFTRFGFLTDNSSATEPPPGENRELSVDRIGFSTSFAGHKNANGLSVGLTALFGRGSVNGTDFGVEDPTATQRLSVRERLFVISIGGDVGRTAAVVGSTVKTRKTQEAVEKDLKIESSTNPEIEAAQQKVEEARQGLESAERELEATEREQEDLRNLNESDQESIQDTSGTVIETVR
jgi:long-subunit fatty acid transport protein